MTPNGHGSSSSCRPEVRSGRQKFEVTRLCIRKDFYLESNVSSGGSGMTTFGKGPRRSPILFMFEFGYTRHRTYMGRETDLTKREKRNGSITDE